jgi:acetyl-CoA C-acetyltransferase
MPDPTVPAFSAVLACSTSMVAAMAAAGLLGGDTDLVLVGGAEVMSNPPIGLKLEASKRIVKLFRTNPAEALAALQALTPDDLVLPVKGWANRITGRTMGDHMEETAQIWGISRAAQDDWALKSHQRAVRGWESGFFDDLVIALPEIARDANPRADTSPEKLAALPPAFDKSGKGSLTAGNSSPIPRLLARHGLRYADIALWEIHEAFAAQVLANVAALEKPGWTRERAGVDFDFGAFPWDRVNPNGGSVAIGHPFAATGARDFSQAVKELWAMPSGALAIVSVCADGGHGTVALLRRP